jgi:hypothetical protein
MKKINKIIVLVFITNSLISQECGLRGEVQNSWGFWKYLVPGTILAALYLGFFCYDEYKYKKSLNSKPSDKIPTVQDLYERFNKLPESMQICFDSITIFLDGEDIRFLYCGKLIRMYTFIDNTIKNKDINDFNFKKDFNYRNLNSINLKSDNNKLTCVIKDLNICQFLIKVDNEKIITNEDTLDKKFIDFLFKEVESNLKK